MSDHGRLLADVSEYEIFDHVVRTIPGSRRSAGCVVTDEESFDDMRTTFAEAATGTRHRAPDVLLVEELKARSNARRRPKVVIVATFGDENRLRAEALDACPDLEPDSVLRLWDDLLVTKTSRRWRLGGPGAGRFYRPAASTSVSVPGTDGFPTSAYALVCTPRSGSTMVADMLEQIGTCGTPREHLRQGVLRLTRETSFDFGAWCGAVMAADSTDNGVFGTKVIAHFAAAADALRRNGRIDLTPLAVVPWRIIRLRRRDLAAQALSTHLAVESKVFFERNDSKRSQRDAFLRDYEYEFDEIVPRYRSLVENEAELDTLVASTSLPVLEVVYEDVLADPTGSLITIQEFLDIDVPQGFRAPTPAIQKLDDTLSGAIYERFRADLDAVT